MGPGRAARRPCREGTTRVRGDRIKELRRVRAAELRPNPKNWRTHPPRQREALRGLLAEVGYADALLARELPDGSLELIDGHLRATTTPEAMVPVLVLDVSAAEADKLLASLDPLAALAGRDEELLERLLAAVQTEDAALRSVLEELRDGPVDVDSGVAAGAEREVEVPESFQVLVECDDEAEQEVVYRRLTEEGYACRVLTL